ncbi:hypothetical protein CYMTET_49774 [Cymbomonas tetramitiformis]|uniref:Uncharacterized protein n=1 Tax=Cymbomonas tetramitiformis TaxID=36881 RepID=A0AAE0ETT5_9CHLO|nr:hypothetical protein CYMTET_49774 [Cymbomonas tetramitiformis]
MELAAYDLRELQRCPDTREKMSRALASDGVVLIKKDSAPIPLHSASSAQASAWELFQEHAESAHSFAQASTAPGVSRGFAGLTDSNITFKDQSALPDAKSTFTIGTNPFSDRTTNIDPTQAQDSTFLSDKGNPSVTAAESNGGQAALVGNGADMNSHSGDLSFDYFAAESAEGKFFATNRWPPQPADLQATWREYADGMHLLADALAGVFELALGLSAGELSGGSFGRAGRHFSELRAVHYPGGGAHAMSDSISVGAASDNAGRDADTGSSTGGNRYRISPHRDFSLFTILQSGTFSSTVPGADQEEHLLLANREGSSMVPALAVREGRLWQALPHREDCYCVLLGSIDKVD